MLMNHSPNLLTIKARQRSTIQRSQHRIMSLPIYLVKVELDSFILRFFVSSRSSEADTVHWTLEINGRQFQLGLTLFRQPKLSLSEPSSTIRSSTEQKSSGRRRNQVGEQVLWCYLPSKAIFLALSGEEVINWMRVDCGWYDAFSMACVNHLWYRIRIPNGPEPYHVLLDLPIYMRGS